MPVYHAKVYACLNSVVKRNWLDEIYNGKSRKIKQNRKTNSKQTAAVKTKQ